MDIKGVQDSGAEKMEGGVVYRDLMVSGRLLVDIIFLASNLVNLVVLVGL